MLVARNLIKYQFDYRIWKAYRDERELKTSELHINPHSVDVTLANVFVTLQPTRQYIDPHDPSSFKHEFREVAPMDCLRLEPGQFVLGCVRERFDTRAQVRHRGGKELGPYVTQLYDGRSTTGRLGIQSHMTAGYGDYGFQGHFTLEICSQLPVILRPGMRIGQISFVGLDTDGRVPDAYSGEYHQLQAIPAIPRLGPGRF